MISKKCKYAIKALIYMAEHSGEKKNILSSEIAKNEQIPKKFLESILLTLRNNQILNSYRGKVGGYSLLKKPSEITLTEIIRIIDGPIALLPCVSLKYYKSCDDCHEENCKIKCVFEDIRDATLNILNNKTIDKFII